VFACGLSARSFEDEYAYIAQSYYADLFFGGHTHDPAWLAFPAYDLPPLPKYLIGLSLRMAHQPVPGPKAAWAWYDHYGHFGTSLTLTIARLPILFVGALGCVAIFGCAVLVKDERVGVIAAGLLMLNPLYRLHTHRAMSDVPCEALMLVAILLFLWSWQRIWSGRCGVPAVVGPCLAGICAGLSLLCKFSAILGLMVITAWSALALVAPSLPLNRRLVTAVATLATIIVAMVVFIGLNPFMTSHPRGPLPNTARELAGMNLWQRFSFQVNHRFVLSDNQKRSFPNDALHTLAEKAAVLAVQGFGRFGPFGPSESDSTARFDFRQDWGAIVWAPLVCCGLAASIRLGWRQCRTGQAPTAIAIVIWAALAWVIVTCYLPMAWDRYLLPIQSGNVLLAALALGAGWDRLARPGAAHETRT